MNWRGELCIFLGSPGAGKGSVARLCADQFGWAQISTGNLCRKHIAQQTKIGKEIDLIIKSGKLISDDLITSLVMEWFKAEGSHVTGVILDGYPRTVVQAQSFDKIMISMMPTVEKYVVIFDISDDVVVDRLCNRLICKNKNCQMVYSSDPASGHVPFNDSLCDKCSSELITRDDDTPETIRKRLDTYHKHEQELVRFYRHSGQRIVHLDATKSTEEIFKDFMHKIGLMGSMQTL